MTTHKRERRRITDPHSANALLQSILGDKSFKIHTADFNHLTSTKVEHHEEERPHHVEEERHVEKRTHHVEVV